MDTFVEQLLLPVLCSAVVSSCVTYLLRTWIGGKIKASIKAEYDERLEQLKSQLKGQTDHAIEKYKATLSIDIETHKATLKGSADSQIESIKSRLQIAAAERHFKFSKLHEQRAEVVARTYDLVSVFHDSVNGYIQGFGPTGEVPVEERHQRTYDAYTALAAYFPGKRIFLPKATAEKIEEIQQKMVSTVNMFQFTIHGRGAANVEHEWYELETRFKTESAIAMSELETEFRMLLGDDPAIAAS